MYCSIGYCSIGYYSIGYCSIGYYSIGYYSIGYYVLIVSNTLFSILLSRLVNCTLSIVCHVTLKKSFTSMCFTIIIWLSFARVVVRVHSLLLLSTGLLLAILHWVNLIKEAQEAAAYQNLLITIEMFGAAVLLWFAFPYKMYQELRKDTKGRGIPMQNISSHFKDTLNPHDVVNDAIHNFSRTYQHYAIQGDLDKDGHNSDEGKQSQTSEEEQTVPHSSGNNSNVSPAGKLSLQNLGLRKKTKDNGSRNDERMTLLIDSDEEEIL